MDDFKTPPPAPPVIRNRKERLLDESTNSSVRIPDTPAMRKLGYGTGVSVYSMTRSPESGSYRSPWAVKKTNRTHQRIDEFEKRIEHEAEILKTIVHPNIVGFRAFTETSDGRKCLVMEECHISLGDLIEARCDENLGPFPINLILKVAIDIASALNYLHSTRHLLHGDIKSANILIKGDFASVKLCDFGVCLPLDANGELDTAAAGHSNNCYIGTLCWSAPEVLEREDGQPCTPTIKADIFSYGLVLWEMLSLQPPHINIGDEDSDASFDEEAYQLRIGTRPPLPNVDSDQYKPIIDIFMLCTEMDFRKRPSAGDLIKKLNAINI